MTKTEILEVKVKEITQQLEQVEEHNALLELKVDTLTTNLSEFIDHIQWLFNFSAICVTVAAIFITILGWMNIKSIVRQVTQKMAKEHYDKSILTLLQDESVFKHLYKGDSDLRRLQMVVEKSLKNRTTPKPSAISVDEA